MEIDVRHEFLGMLAAAAANKHARKEASIPLGSAYLLAEGGGAAAGLFRSAAKGAAAYAVPAAALYIFSKYLAIPAFAGYAMGNSMARSMSPSKADLDTAENNALAKETMRRTKLLEQMPSVTPQRRDKDMMTRRSVDLDQEAF